QRPGPPRVDTFCALSNALHGEATIIPHTRTHARARAGQAVVYARFLVCVLVSMHELSCWVFRWASMTGFGCIDWLIHFGFTPHHEPTHRSRTRSARQVTSTRITQLRSPLGASTTTVTISPSRARM